ncbi:NAD(P)-binding protein [Periconia macrospinosa]|uniref:NAD(P)-binding protein n=1 Tax=Periconia macrospinosa TaxID=97972 RepID=A0A2V1E1V5_9PLEO|nr:NAD(P)-binding protein [Periconia macrospinosa]
MPSSKELPPNTASFIPIIYLKNQLCTKPIWPTKETNLSGKVAVITGANSGLGLEAGRQLLSLGLSRLIISVRSTGKGEEAARKLRTEYPKAILDVYPVDMVSYDSIQAFTEKLKQLERIDIVILNAGIMVSSFKTAQSTGHEETFQVNYLSTVLLCTLLLPILKVKAVGGPGRITIVASGLAYAAQFNNRKTTPIFPTFDVAKNFSMDTYNVTKLLLMMYLYKLVDYVSAEDVVVNTVDPGYVKGTNLQSDKGLVLSILMKGFDVATARTVDVGASTYIDAAVSHGKESHGSYIMGWKISSFASLMYTPDGKKTIEQVWKETEKELGFANFAGILQSMKKA